jgi:hypothetical protein
MRNSGTAHCAVCHLHSLLLLLLLLQMLLALELLLHKFMLELRRMQLLQVSHLICSARVPRTLARSNLVR